MKGIERTFHALRELGIRRISLYALYRLGLQLRWFPVVPKPVSRWKPSPVFTPLFPLPPLERLRSVLSHADEQRLFQEANAIVLGRFHPFGIHELPLRWEKTSSRQTWIAHALGLVEQDDTRLKAPPAGDEVTSDWRFIWEPARLGWVFTLGRAYYLSGEARYARSFWELVEGFLEANPPYYGLHWVSAQEAGLRILALAFAWHVFARAEASTPERLASLCHAIAFHAQRIPPTMMYARAQNNNHLLSEAAGLLTAGLVLPDHPHSRAWVSQGWRAFVLGLGAQIEEHGVYLQHSANYQRMMLQLALWVRRMGSSAGLEFKGVALQRLQAATRWLSALMEAENGRLPNLGPNDGSDALPLSVCPFEDYRPTLQAAAMAFLGTRLLPAGSWDEMALWLVEDLQEAPPKAQKMAASHNSGGRPPEPLVLSAPAARTWAYLRAVEFRSRPGHADQLHLDIWWRGHNLAMDAGTFLYNAPPPWDNSLSSTLVHNTVTVDGQDQMLRAGRFLYLRWAQARLVTLERDSMGNLTCAVAEHDGYQRLNLIHRRHISLLPQGDWLVEDFLLPLKVHAAGRVEAHRVCLHWLIPQGLFRVESSHGYTIALEWEWGRAKLQLQCVAEGGRLMSAPELQIIRGGELQFGSGECPAILGWYSPTYGVKIPALSVRLQVQACAPLKMQTLWQLSAQDPSSTKS